MMSRKLLFRIALVFVIGIAIYRFYTNQPEYTQVHITGQTMGTITYNVKYLGENVPNYKEEIDSILEAFNRSLSTYIPGSEISRLNKEGVLIRPSEMFQQVLTSSKEVFEVSNGAFDPTVGPLVNLWGFGPEKKISVPDSNAIQKSLDHVGFQKIRFSGDSVTMDSAMFLDFSAIAKGYAVDLVAGFLESRGSRHFMVEIGGEVRAEGQNEHNEPWRIGIEDPLVEQYERKILAIIQLRDLSMATSGNYRNYYKIGDRTIAHTIDPRTGYNTTHHLLSATVFAENCMLADAYATAFMVLGLDESKRLLKLTGLKGFLIYQDEDGHLKSYVSPELADAVVVNHLI